MTMPIPLPANFLSLPDLLVIAFLALLIFGPGKLAGLGKGLGDGIKNFKDAVNDGKSGVKADEEKK